MDDLKRQQRRLLIIIVLNLVTAASAMTSLVLDLAKTAF